MDIVDRKEGAEMKTITKFGDCKIKTYDVSDMKQIAFRSSTGGYQPKYLIDSDNLFIKMQATLSGVLMEDWLVEIIASDFCYQLGIPCVKQEECNIKSTTGIFKGVVSKNFERAGHTYVSFRAIAYKQGKTLDDSEFNKLSSSDKIKWCASILSKGCNINYDDCLKYMLDAALIDILVGNIDRHDKNYGVFYNNVTGKFEIADLFDSGMGLFENDYYRDNYKSYEDAMRHVYVAPYGEDPFDLLDIIENEFGKYQYDFNKLKYPATLPNEYSKIYLDKVFERIGVTHV